MKEKFTPGPWIEAGPSYGKGSMQKVSCIVPENDPDDEFDDICFFPDYVDDNINRANARLIAAAPDMYEALKSVLADVQFMIEDGYIGDVMDDILYVHANAALAKADGIE